MNLEQKIEAVLFWKSEPMKKKELARIFGASDEETDEALSRLKENLSSRGVVLLENGEEVALGTAPELSDVIEKLRKEEISRELSRASLETLSIVLYQNGASRSLVDYIRGVNSSFILRSLSTRGLVEKVPDPEDARRYLYRPTLETLAYLGIRSVSELPEYDSTVSAIREVEAKMTQEEKDAGAQ